MEEEKRLQKKYSDQLEKDIDLEAELKKTIKTYGDDDDFQKMEDALNEQIILDKEKKYKMQNYIQEDELLLQEKKNKLQIETEIDNEYNKLSNNN